MNLARQNQNCPDSIPDIVLGALASRRRVDGGLAGGTPALPGTALRTAALLAVLGALLANGRTAAAPTTNAPAATNNYSSFQIIAERNIFDPNRYAHTSHSHRRSVSKSAPYFSLVGTLS